MEIEVITSDDQPTVGVGSEEHRPLSLGCEALGGSTVENRPLETIEETPDVKAKPKRSARSKAVRFEGTGVEAPKAVGDAGSSSTPAEPKVKAKSRSKASTRPSPGEKEAVAVAVAAEAKEPVLEPLSEEAAAIVGRWQAKNGPGRGRPPGARNKPKPPQIVEKMVYEKPPPLSPQDLQALLKDTLRKQELDAREQKRAYYSQLIRRNR